MSLPESLEQAAVELPELAEAIRPANGDPHRLIEELSAGDAERLLGWILGEAPADADELVEAWSEHDAGVPVLLGLSDDGIGKAGRKLLRRARHRLRSQGIGTPAAASATAAPVAGVRRRGLPGGERWQAAHVTPPDFRGSRMGYLVESHPAGGARLFEIRFAEGRGVADFKVYNAARNKVRGFLKSLTEPAGSRLHEIERDALRALVWRAAASQPADRPLPTSFVEWRGRLFGDELEKTPTPGDLARERLGGAPLEASLASVVAEVEAGRLGPWPPSTSWVGDRMEQGREAVEGLEGDARGAAIEGWLTTVTEALGEATDHGLIARHLSELAWLRAEAGDEDEARGLVAVADAIDGDDAAARSRLDRARAASLFEPFLASLRVVESDALAEESAG